MGPVGIPWSLGLVFGVHGAMLSTRLGGSVFVKAVWLIWYSVIVFKPSLWLRLCSSNGLLRVPRPLRCRGGIYRGLMAAQLCWSMM